MKKIYFKRKRSGSPNPFDLIDMEANIDTESEDHDEIKKMISENLNISEEEIKILKIS